MESKVNRNTFIYCRLMIKSKKTTEGYEAGDKRRQYVRGDEKRAERG